ncbi:MAG: DEAD/DEAH box helicase [Caldilineaceae bacterium]
MTLEHILHELRTDPNFMASVAAWETMAPRPAQMRPIPENLSPQLRETLALRGYHELYSHQAEAVEHALAGRHVVVVTPTASGKTLCYNLPILHSVISEPAARALYLFPTKALAQDQLAELNTWVSALEHATPEGHINASIGVATYDGDTPSSRRPGIRNHSRLILTNPDMLHTGILPYHANWESFFAGLRYVVLDEMHTYRGVFGSHVANVLRRLRRVCEFYGSQPQFICTSATIANPSQLAERLVEEPVTLVDENGAPRGEKHVILYNPPVYDAVRGLRESSTLAAQELAGRCVLGGAQTIVFGRSRLVTELLLSYLREKVHRAWDEQSRAVAQPAAEAIRGYRGGYLPLDRRSIEAGLRSGAVRAVVATNALELGIDIGKLQAAVLCGYPGSIASTWQQMGRAGRTQDAALAILVATGGALDQYVIRHPEFIFERSPEHALVNPDNLMLLLDQIRCAAFELPFAAGDGFGNSHYTADVLDLLCEEGDVVEQTGRFFWSGLSYPARSVGLRSSSADSVTIQAQLPDGKSGNEALVIGEIDLPSAPLLVHTGAVYLHEGQSYHVDDLDMENGLASVTPVEVDYYTDVVAETSVEVLAEHDRRLYGGSAASYGDLRVSVQVLGYRRVKRFTHETLGVFPLEYPPQILETSGYWCSVLPEAQSLLEQTGQWRDSVNDYGPNWGEVRRLVRERDGYRCTKCGRPEPEGREHDVHHLIPFRVFGYVPGLNDHYLQANRLDNLVLVCRTCHQRLEASVRTRGGLAGLGYALNNLAPLYLMCDWSDIGVHIVRAERPGHAADADAKLSAGPNNPSADQEHHSGDDGEPSDGKTKPSDAALPAVFVFEQAVAGLGFSARLFELHETLLDAAAELIDACPCAQGCPACVGPILEQEQASLETKALTRALVNVLRGTYTLSAPASSQTELTF